MSTTTPESSPSRHPLAGALPLGDPTSTPSHSQGQAQTTTRSPRWSASSLAAGAAASRSAAIRWACAATSSSPLVLGGSPLGCGLPFCGSGSALLAGDHRASLMTGDRTSLMTGDGPSFNHSTAMSTAHASSLANPHRESPATIMADRLAGMRFHSPLLGHDLSGSAAQESPLKRRRLVEEDNGADSGKPGHHLASPTLHGKRRLSSVTEDDDQGNCTYIRSSSRFEPCSATSSPVKIPRRTRLLSSSSFYSDSSSPPRWLQQSSGSPSSNATSTHHASEDVVSLSTNIDLCAIEEHLQKLQRRMEQALPYSRDGHGKDAYSFNRIRPFLVDLKRMTLHYAYKIVNAARSSPMLPAKLPSQPSTSSLSSWKVAFSFLNTATTLVVHLREFDDDAHNEIKHDLLMKLARLYTVAIALVRVPDDLVPRNAQDLERCAKCLSMVCKEMQGNAVGIAFTAVVQQFQSRLGWLSADDVN
jgi:hypothetical protein